MRRLLPALTLAACLPASLTAFAQEAPRFAIFAPEQLLRTSKRAQKIFTKLEVKGKELQDRLKDRADEMQKLDQQLKSSSLSEEGRAKLQRELQDKELSFKRLQEDSDKEFRAVQQEVFGAFEKEVGPIVQELAKEQRLNVVFQYNPQTQPFFAYTDETWAVAFTQEISKRYDAKFPTDDAGTAPEKPAPKPATKK